MYNSKDWTNRKYTQRVEGVHNLLIIHCEKYCKSILNGLSSMGLQMHQHVVFWILFKLLNICQQRERINRKRENEHEHMGFALA